MPFTERRQGRRRQCFSSARGACCPLKFALVAYIAMLSKTTSATALPAVHFRKDYLMHKYTASFLGRDCPGVVAAVSRILEENGCNIEEVTQTILSGEFAAIFVVAAPDGTDAESLRQNLSASLAEAKVDLSVLVRPAIKGQWGQNLHCEPFVVTADGPDKPGLIAAMSRVFARHDVNIESLKAILGEGGTNRALFVFEVMVPDSVDLGRLRRELTCEGQSRDLRVSVQHRDIFEAVNRVNSF